MIAWSMERICFGGIGDGGLDSSGICGGSVLSSVEAALDSVNLFGSGCSGSM